MTDKKPVILSGIKPSGTLTIGNYIGALKNFVKLQNDYDCFYSVVDLHAITVKQEPKDLRNNSYAVLALYLAAGLDPENNTIFLQSHVTAHSELAWILNCSSTFGELSRMTQFKDKSQKSEVSIGAGLFTYPVLMAADILLYQTNVVPIGDDQKQHLELARNIAERFNSTYSPTFVVPEPYMSKTGARIMSLQDPAMKMEKSNPNAGSYISIIDDPKQIINKIKRAVTDSEASISYDDNRPAIKNLLTIYSSFSGKTPEEIVKMYEGQGYAEFKKDLGEVIVEGLTPIREKYNELMKDKKYLDEVLKNGAEKASRRAYKTLSKVQRKVGFIQRS
jgi:tryptophanyl-tRNA synthetase